MLKPVRPLQLRKAVSQVREKIEEQQALGKAFTVENIFTGCLNGQVFPDRKFHQMTREKFGFTLEDPGALFVVWLGGGYAEQREMVRVILENAGTGKGFSVCAVPIDTWHLVAAAVYRIGRGSEAEKSPNANRAEEALSFDHEFAVIREQIVPALSGSVRGEIACLWEETEHMEGFPAVLRSMRQIREWNLLFDRGEIIRRKDVEAL